MITPALLLSQLQLNQPQQEQGNSVQVTKRTVKCELVHRIVELFQEYEETIDLHHQL